MDRRVTTRYPTYAQAASITVMSRIENGRRKYKMLPLSDQPITISSQAFSRTPNVTTLTTVMIMQYSRKFHCESPIQKPINTASVKPRNTKPHRGNAAVNICGSWENSEYFIDETVFSA